MLSRLALLTLLALFFLASLTIIGCQPANQGSRTYTTGQAQRALEVYYGTVLKVADVQIQAPQTGAGTMVGGVTGGIVGSTVGSGRGRKLATTAGALGGAALGSAAEKSQAMRPGLEIEVELDDGRLMVIVQEKDDEFAVGDRVRMVQSPDGSMRIRQ